MNNDQKTKSKDLKVWNVLMRGTPGCQHIEKGQTEGYSVPL